jgi:hypothetical protein
MMGAAAAAVPFTGAGLAGRDIAFAWRTLKTSRDVYSGSESACDLSLVTLYARKAAKSRRNLQVCKAFAAAFDRL